MAAEVAVFSKEDILTHPTAAHRLHLCHHAFALQEEESNKKETADHQTATDSPGPQGSGPGDDYHDSSDHLFTDEDFFPSPSMEAHAEPEPVPVPEVSDDASEVPIERQTVLESEQTEVATAVPLEVLAKSSARLEVKEMSGEGSSYSEGADIPVSILRDAPAVGPPPLLERRASWRNCCGLLDVFGGSRS